MEPLDELSYNPEPPKYYNYNIDNLLDKNGDYIKFRLYKNVNICSYEINNDGKYPFLKFLLCKNNYLQNLSFPKIPLFSSDTIEIMNYIQKYLHTMLLLEDFERFTNNIVINGYYEYNDELFLFIDLTECKLVINDIYSDSNLWFILVDEIFNHKHICNIKIDPFVFVFFNNNYTIN